MVSTVKAMIGFPFCSSSCRRKNSLASISAEILFPVASVGGMREALTGTCGRSLSILDTRDCVRNCARPESTWSTNLMGRLALFTICMSTVNSSFGLTPLEGTWTVMERFGGSETECTDTGRVGESILVSVRPYAEKLPGFPVMLGFGDCRALPGGLKLWLITLCAGVGN